MSGKGVAYCSTCKANDCSKVRMPYVLRYLTNELAAMNVKMTYKMKWWRLSFCIIDDLIIYVYIITIII